VKRSSNLLNNVIPICLGMVLVMLFMSMMLNRSMGGDAGRMTNFGKSRAQMIEPETMKIRFEDVAGLQEEKEEVEEIVDFLRNPGKYVDLGARIPKGVILVGPPGTGKTLLAKAIAGEAGVPFFSISGSDFVEMFVGVGASRVRDLFEQAKKNAPCIVFIDEIDAVARRRGSGLGGGHDEREQTLNQLLVEMDGFGVNEGIIVIAATNRVDILDPAILRPGRFDRKVAVGRPDVKGREEILRVHTRKKKLDESVDLHQIARTTPGFTGADLENLINESAIRAARENSRCIRMEDIQKSFIKVGVGTEKKSRLIPEKERKITAYHEAGHAILFHVLPDVGPVHTISIIPTGVGAAGYTMPLPENDNVFNTKGKMIQDIKVGMGGRIAEELIFGDVTTGASQDIKDVTNTARAMVTQYGMSEKVGFLNYEQNSDEVFLGRDLGHARPYGEDVAKLIDEEVKRIVDECYQDARRIIQEHMDVLHACANLLLEKEKITRDEFENLFQKEG
ncbi:MAG: ATP-dependent zinc metalloprotease FtsH, partial [Eubacterium sp.]|nr:ATP-dependent zinc metalloprotease FtsH [Eubacterium sp.]